MQKFFFKIFAFCLLSTILTHSAAQPKRPTTIVDITALARRRTFEQYGFIVQHGSSTVVTTLCNDCIQIICDQSPEGVIFTAIRNTAAKLTAETSDTTETSYTIRDQTSQSIPFATVTTNPDESKTETVQDLLRIPKTADFDAHPIVKMQPFYPAQNTEPSETLIVFGWPRRTDTSPETKLYEAFLVHHATQETVTPWVQRLAGRTALHRNIMVLAGRFMEECTKPTASAKDSETNK